MLSKRRCAYFAPAFLALLAGAGCVDNGREPVLSEVDTVPSANPADPQSNQNISNPTLEIPETFPIQPGVAPTLVWSEEFDGGSLDPEVWFFATGDGSEAGLPGGWGNNELQYYLPDNAQVEGGVLKITARRESVGGLGYTSARINTQDRFAFRYGRIEARIKLPSGQGLWPAFWMLSQDSPYGSWAATGEIDIMEAVNLDGTPRPDNPDAEGGGNTIFGTIYYGGEFPNQENSSETYVPSEDVTEDFHVYAVEWDEGEIRWYFNDTLYAVQNSWFSTAAPFPAPFDQPFHILLNLAVGGNFPGFPNADTVFPAVMEVDWVRVYSGGEPFVPADPGITPDNVVYASDPAVTEDLAPPAIDNFGSGAVFDTMFAGDADFSPAIQVASGEGYGAGVHVGFIAFNGYPAGFADSYENLVFKVKADAANITQWEVKFINGGDTSVVYDLTTYAGVTDLGNGWLQVTVPMSDFAATKAMNSGFLMGPLGGQPAAFTYLTTDIGFTGDTGADPGITPDNVVYATDPAVTEDLAPPAVDNFGSGAVFDTMFAGDGDFSPAIQVTSGEGYGAGVHSGFMAFNGYAAGFADGFENFVFKVKADATNITQWEVKFINGGDTSVVYDLTTYAGVTDLGNGWLQVTVPMSDFAATKAMNSGFLLGPLGGQPAAFTYLMTDIGFTGTAGGGGGGGGGGSGGPGEQTVNGDVEAGDLSGFEIFPGGGTITVDNTENNTAGGMWSIHAVAGPGNNPVIKQERRAAGVVMPNQQVTLSFDMKGTAAAGGVVFAELFSEGAGGAVAAQLLDTIPAPTADWTTYTYTPNVAADVTDGITFQIAVVCGADAACTADVFVDNISIVVN